MANSENDYIERHRYWQDQAINQLSNANNFMLTISIGLLAFCFDKEVFLKMNFNLNLYEISWSLTLYFFALMFLTFSIIYGIIVLITRLYDFRITRNISLTRQRYYEENEKNITDKNPNAAVLPASEFLKPKFCKRTSALFKVIFVEIDLLTKEECLEIKTNKSVLNKFNLLREFSFILGTISWRLPRFQALFFGLATMLYILSLLIPY